MKTIGKFNNSFSANICKGVLEDNGVPAFVLNENLIWTAGVANTDLIPIEVVVDDEYYDKGSGDSEIPTGKAGYRTVMRDNVYFVSGIDTNIGKSYATGYLARIWNGQSIRTITQETDTDRQYRYIRGHRTAPAHHGMRAVGRRPRGIDHARDILLPLLAASGRRDRTEGEIDFDKIERATAELSNRFDAVLLEGAGGLMVPLTRELLTIDYIARKGYPLIYVTSGPPRQHKSFPAGT